MPLNSVHSDLRSRLLVTVLLILMSYVLWIVLEPYKLRFLASIIPVLFVIQLLLNDLLSSILVNKFYKTFWFKFIIAPGTILHELCHMVAALVTGCTVNSVSLFNVNPESGTLGYVKYSNPEDNWHVLRGFLVGLSPFLGCGMVILLINAVLGGTMFGSVGTLVLDSRSNFISVFASILSELFSSLAGVSARGIPYLVLIYIQLCFAIGAAPSSQDFKTAISAGVRHPLSSVFLVLSASLLVLLAESPLDLFGLGPIVASGIMTLFKFIVYVLLLSSAVLVVLIPVVLLVAWFMSVKDRLKYLVLALAVIVFLISNDFMDYSGRIIASLAVFAALMIALTHPKFFLKKK